MVHLRGPPSWTMTRKTKIAANSNVYQRHDDDDDDSLSQSRLTSLAKKGKFDLLHQDLNDMSNKKFSKMLQEEHQSCSILHIVLAHCPPLPIVELLLKRMKESNDDSTNNAYPVTEEILDASGKTPLHLAVAAGCNVAVIDRLLSGVSLLVPALTKDLLDRYPLHYACCMPQHNASKKKGLSVRAVQDNRRETIYTLLNTYPVAVVIPDVHGKTPLDYAIENKLDARIVDALQKVAKQHKQCKVGVAARNTTAPPSTKPKPHHLKRKLLGGGGKSSSLPSAAVVRPPTSEMRTEHDSTDANEEDEDKDFLPEGLCLTNSNSFSRRRNMLRLDSNHMVDDLSSLGWDILSAGAAATAPGTKKSGPSVRAKTLTVSPSSVQQATTPSLAATTVISSHIRCRCKSLLSGGLKTRSSKGGGGGGGAKKKTIKNQPPQRKHDTTVAAAAPVEQGQSVVVVLVGQQDEENKTVGECRRFISC